MDVVDVVDGADRMKFPLTRKKSAHEGAQPGMYRTKATLGIGREVTTTPENEGSDDALPTEALVTKRASGRLPEEMDSDCPEAQAREILEESEQRTLESADSSDRNE
jgi:hypothetical protein